MPSSFAGPPPEPLIDGKAPSGDVKRAIKVREDWLQKFVTKRETTGASPTWEELADCKRVNRELLDLADQLPGTPDWFKHPTSPGQRSGRKLANTDRLFKGESVVEWLKARGDGEMPGGVSTDDAWDYYADGLLKGDWSRWAANMKSMAESGSGNMIVPTPLAGSVIDRLRANTPIFQAGAQTIPMTSSTQAVARVTGDPAPAWRNELATVTSSDMTLDRVTLTARSLSVLVRFSRELDEDANNLGSVLQTAIAGAVGAELNRVALRGSGTPPEPKGIRNQTGVEQFAIGANGGALTVDMLIDRYTTIGLANTTPNAMIFNPRTNGGLTKLCKDSQGNYFPLPAPLNELGRYQTSIIPNNLVKGTSSNTSEVYMGDFRNLMVGMRVPMQISPLRERYADTGEYAVWVWVRADIALAHGEAFSVVTDTTT